MYSFDPIVAGQVYYLEKKFTSGRSEYHVAQPGETLLNIAQQHGIRLKSILSKNRMKKNESLVAGRLLWLQQTRPANIAVEYRRIETPAVPKTPQPLVAPANTNIKDDARKEGSTLATIKETASTTFHKAGEVLNVPEKQREVAKVGEDNVFEESFELNPEAKKETPAAPKTETVAKTEAIEENLASINETSEPVTTAQPADQKPQEVIAKTETPTASAEVETAANSEQTAPETAEITNTASADNKSATSENPGSLYPKTLAKTEQKVVLQEPTETEPAAAKPEVILNEPTET